ncbi:MAG: nickel-dependent hydrogenase large subunit [Fimbriimonadaceae bacterium]
MSDATNVPFGPQHPVLPEPIQLRISLEDENVLQALPALGYVHRGIEKAGELNDFQQNVFLVERVCGICSSIHALAYCLAVESAMGLEVPKRADYLRVVWMELHRIHSHLLYLGLLAEAFGFESMFMEFWRIRERIMDLLEMTAGNRVIISVCTIGGVRRDIDAEQARTIREELPKVREEVQRLVDALLGDYTVKRRTAGKGVISGQAALDLGAVGPTLRGSGVAQDMRMAGYAAYSELQFQPVTFPDGDTYSRTAVRAYEVFQSMDLVLAALENLPEGELAAKFKGRPDGAALARVEAPRGELIYMVVGNGTKNLERMRVRVPTYANIPALLSVLPGCEFADVPVVTLSIDPCISCTER